MQIQKYKRLHNINFALTNSAIIYTNDLFVSQDLIELIELVIKGKNPDPQLIKFEDCDSISANKSTQILKIPSLFDLRKNVFSGTKALLTLLIKEIVANSKFKNETLNLLQNLLTSFDFLTQFEQIENLQNEVEQLTDIKLEITLDEVIEKYFAENFLVSFFKNDEAIKDDEISLLDSRIIYFKILELLAVYWDHEIIALFDNPYFGLNYKEIKILEAILEKLPNKILVLNTISEFKKVQLENLTILFNNLSINLPMILNNWTDYQFYLSKKYDPVEFIFNFASKMQGLINLYDDEWINYQSLSNDEKLFWDNLKNKIIF